MGKLTDAQIAGAAKNAGFTGSALATAVAIALAESGGDSSAVNNKNSNGSIDRGLWQINSVHDSKPGDRFNPTDNAKLAFQISSGGTNWTPWSVYKSGAYRMYSARAQIAAGAPVDPGPGTGAGGSGSDPTAGLSFLTNTTLWARVGVFLLAGALLIFALWKLTGVGDAVVGAAKGVVSARTGGLVKL